MSKEICDLYQVEFGLILEHVMHSSWPQNLVLAYNKLTLVECVEISRPTIA